MALYLYGTLKILQSTLISTSEPKEPESDNFFHRDLLYFGVSLGWSCLLWPSHSWESVVPLAWLWRMQIPERPEPRPWGAFLCGAGSGFGLRSYLVLQRLPLPTLTFTCLLFCLLIVVLAVMWPSSKTFPTWETSSTGKWARWETSGQFRHLGGFF